MKKISKFIIGMSAVFMALPLSSCNSGRYEEKEVNVYVGDSVNKFKQKIYFKDKNEKIPYIKLTDDKEYKVQDVPETGVQLLNKVKYLTEGPYSCARYTSIKESDNLIIKKENNGEEIYFNSKNNTIYSDDLTSFQNPGFSRGQFDLSGFDSNFYDSNGKSIENEVRFLKRASYGEINGNSVLMDLELYNISVDRIGDNFFIPLNTFFSTVISEVCIPFNGKDLFVVGNELDNQIKNSDGKTLKDLFYSIETSETRDKSLAEYSYYEFCRNLDFNYGLAAEHGITTDFDTYFATTGYREKLLSLDYKDYQKALMELTCFLFADSHTGKTFDSPYKPSSIDATEYAMDPTLMNKGLVSGLITQQIRMNKGITELNASGTGFDIKNPIEIRNSDGQIKNYDDLTAGGATMYITFDSFVMKTDIDGYYYNPESTFKTDREDVSKLRNDCVLLVNKANEIIQNDQKNKKFYIKNVVLDVTLNAGGMADSCFYILSWLTSGTIYLENPNTGSKGFTVYNADVNFDKKLDMYDTLPLMDIAESSYSAERKKVNLYCLTSENSFSCGNLLPAGCRQSNNVSVIGRTSGGGACSVQMHCLADGTGFAFSSNNRLCNSINGSYYHIDKGITPDYVIKDFNNLYDRSGYLNNYLKNL